MNLNVSINWKTRHVGDIMDIFTGKKDVNQTVLDGKYIFFSCSPETFLSNDYICDDSALIIAGNGSYTGTTRFFKGKFDLYQRAYGCTIKKELKSEYDIKYIFYQFKKNFERDYMGGSRGSSIPYIVRGDIENYELKFPDTKEEQERLSKIFESLDDKIELLRKENKTLENIAQTLFKEWFVDFNFPGITGKMINSELGKIPEGWRVGKLKDVLEIKNGFAFKSEDYIKDKQYPIIRTMNFEDLGYINSNNLVYIAYEKAKEYKNFNFEEFDLCVVMVGASLGNIAIVTKINLPALQNQNMWSFKPKSKEFRFYINFQIKNIIKNNINSASGSARDFFRKDHFYNIDILIPQGLVIFEFEKIVYPMYQKISNNILEIKTLSKLRDELLNKIFSN